MTATKAEPSTIKAKFLQAWLSVENPPLDKVNPHFGNKYASLEATLGVVRAACKPVGIAYLQQLEPVNEGHQIRSFVMAEDGTTMECSRFPIEVPPNPQTMGSLLTYAKRQQAQLDWGIVGEEDDDGEAAANAPRNAQGRRGATDAQGSTNKAPSGRQNASSAKKKPTREDYVARVNQLIEKAIGLGIKGSGINEYMQAKFHTVNTADLNIEQLTELGQHLKQNIEDKKQLMGDEVETL